MVELVIKIPKELYESYKGRSPKLGDAGMDMIAQSIANGTPLPKGHGRLISEEDMLSVIMFSKLFDDANVGEVKEALLNIPTIIEAECTYKETGCGSCKWQLDCPIEAEGSESE